MNNQFYQVEEQDVGKRIDKYLSEKIKDHSRAFVQKLIKEDNILVNDHLIKSNYKLRLNDELKVMIPMPKELNIVSENIPLDILFEDDDLLVVNKPQGMVVHPAAGHYSGTLVNAIMYHCRTSLSGINGVMRPGIVHRIDKDTSGVLVVCKNDVSHVSIAQQLKEHSITRKYHAIVYNNIKTDKGTINAPIGRHPIHRKKMCVNNKSGKESITHYTVLERFNNKYTYVQLQLETGRTHQIRVHMANIHHSLLGDPVYGPQKDPFKLNGQALHAKVLGFVHPRTDEYMEFEAPLPSYFEKLISKLKK